MRMLKSVAEQKYFDKVLECTAIADSVLSTKSAWVLITEPDQGTGAQERIGDRINVNSIEIQMISYFPYNEANADTALGQWRFRFIVFVWKDDTDPEIDDILEDPTRPTISPFRHDQKVKRKILYDKVFTQTHVLYEIPDVSASVTTQNEHIHKKIILPSKLWKKNSNIYFQAGTDTGTNHVYWFALSETNTINQTWNLNVYSRVNYTDI